LAAIMTRHPEVELRIVGPMEVPDSLKRFEGHIKHEPLVPWRKWLSVLNTFDVNLAPLESGNPFCEAKSEIKYTEAALVGIPTVASRIRAYEVAMQDGETGFLAGTADEWIEKVEALVTDSGLRRRMGEASRADVLAHYTPEVLSEELMGTLTTIQDQYAQRKAAALATARSSFKTPLILNWVFPEPIPGSGGHMDIIRMINLLSSFGHHNRAYVVPRISLWDKNDLEIRDAVRRQFGPLRANLYKWDGGLMDESDGVILTHWTTAYMIEEVRNSSKVFYFVQDWEPFFFPMSDQYLRAEQTYKMGFSCITLGPWLTERLTSWYDADADYFDFAVDHEIFYPRSVKKPERPRVCFYARPSTPRRLFPMGVQALELVHERRPEAEIVFYGVDDDELRRYHVPFPHTNRGILNEEELAELFSSCDLGIVLSSTNCSLVPPEMMACRCAVVDLDRETVKGVLEHRVNAMLAEPTPEGIAEAVVSLLDDDSLRMKLVETAYKQVQERSWVRSAREVERILYQKLPASRRALERRQWKASPALPASKDLPAMQRGLLDAIHKTRRKTVARWRAGAKGWAVRLVGGNRGIVLNGKPVYTVGELTGGRSIGQSFAARHDNLHRIDLLVGTYGRRNTRDVILHLKESPEASHALATVHLNAALLADGAYARFVFEPQPDSSGRSYYLCVESPESVPGDAITLWAYRRVDLADATLHKDGRISAGQLVFGLFYVDEQLGEVGERPLLQGWTPAGALLWRRMEKGARLLAKGELNRLRQEVADYWAWRSGRT
jgi:glycosyltransferase involved in cell wall biosynthesis